MKGYTMKKTFLTTLFLLTLTLTACSGTASTNQASSTQENAALPTATQLVVGTLNLEGTEQAVTSEQAKELLVMWQVYQGLTSSSSAAQAEIDGLVEQIQEIMTAGQMESIAAMDLTQQDVFAVMQEQGGMGQAPQSGGDSSSTQGGGGFAPPDGGMAGGAPPDGGGGAPPDGGMAMGGAGSVANTDEGQETESGPSAGGTPGIPAPLVEALIQVLEQKASS